MPNFDTLRTSTLGALSYICRPKEKPSELLGCWNFNTINPVDISRYDGSVTRYGSWTEDSSYTYVPYIVYKSTSSYYQMGLGKSLNLASPWSLDMGTIGYNASQYSGESVVLGELQISTRHYSIRGIYLNGTRILDTLTQNGQNVWNVGITYDGTKLRVFRNGSYLSEVTTSLSGNVSSIKFQVTGNPDVQSAFIQARCIQKRLGTDTTYPVPSTPYTGFEAI